MALFFQKTKAYKKSIFVGLSYGLMLFALTATYIYADNYNWTSLQNGVNDADWRAVSSAADYRAAVKTGGYIYISADSGLNWTATGEIADWTDVAVAKNNYDYMLASTGNGSLYRSNDHGNTWDYITNSGASINSVAVSSDGSTMLAVGDLNFLLKSSDYGLNWFNLDAPSGGHNFSGVAMSSDGAILYITADNNGAYRSGDGGSSWTPLSLGDGNFSDVDTSSDGSVVLISHLYGSVVLSKNSGTSFNAIGVGAYTWKAVKVSSDGQKMVVVPQSTYPFTSIDGGDTWGPETSAGSFLWEGADFFNIDSAVDEGLILAGSNVYLQNGTAKDVTPPVITTITSDKINGYYPEGTSFNISLNFSELVSSSGNIDLHLDNGATCTITSFSEQSSASCFVVIQSGQDSPDLTVSSIELNVGTVADVAGNILTNLTPETNLGESGDLVVDTTGPTLENVTSGVNNGFYNVGDFMSVIFEFSERVTSSANVNVVFNTGGTCTFTISHSTTTQCQYDINSGENSSDLNTVSISGGSIVDEAGNSITNLTPPTSHNLADNKDIQIDTTAPPAIESTPDLVGSSDTGISNSDNVTNSISPTFHISGCENGDSVLLKSSEVEEGYVGTGSCIDGEAIFSVGEGSLPEGTQNITPYQIDPAGNVSEPGTHPLTIIIDTTAPSTPQTPNLLAADDSGYSDTDNITMQRSVTIDTPHGECNPNYFVTLYINGSSYADQACDLVDGDYSFNVINLPDDTYTVQAVLFDRAGNLSGFSSPLTLVVDNVPPVVSTANSDKTDGYYKVGDSVDVDLNFSEPVYIDTGSLSVRLNPTVNSTYALCDLPTNTLTATTTCDYQIQTGENTTDLDVRNLTGSTVMDAAGNSMVNFIPVTNLAASKNIIIDTTSPIITSVTSDTSDGAYGAGTPIDIDFTFSEPVTSNGDVTVTLDTGGLCVFNVTNSATATCNYTVQDGENSSDLNATSITGVFYDRVNNEMTNFVPVTNLAANKNIVIDTVPLLNAPSILSFSNDEGVSSSDNITSDTNLNFVGTASGNSIVKLYKDSVFLASTTATVGGDWNIDTGTLTDGTYAFTATNQQIGGRESNESNTINVTIDATAPEAPTIIAFNDDTGHADSITTDNDVTFSGSTQNDVVAINLYKDNSFVTTVTPDESHFWAAATGVIADGNYNFTARSVDVAGNESVSSDPFNIIIDTTIPTINSINSDTANGSYKVGDVIDVDVHFSEAVTGELSLTLNSTSEPCVVTMTSSSIGTCNYTIQSGDTEGELDVTNIVPNGSILDQAENELTNFTPQTTFAENKNIVIVTSTPPPPGNNSENNSGGGSSSGGSYSNYVTIAPNGGYSSAGWGWLYSSGATSSISTANEDIIYGTSTSSLCPLGYICTRNRTNSLNNGTGNFDSSANKFVGSSSTDFSKGVISGTSTTTYNIITVFKKDLNKGSVDADVISLQRFLNQQGFSVAKSGAGSYGKETSVFGYKTFQALMRFQKALNINPVDGFFGIITRGWLNSMVSGWMTR